MDTIITFAKENFDLITLFVGVVGVVVSVISVYYEMKVKKNEKPKTRLTKKPKNRK